MAAPDMVTEAASDRPPVRRRSLDPVLMMLAAMALAITLTWIIPSGAYTRMSGGDNAPVVPGTYRQLPKPLSIRMLLPADVPETAGSATPGRPAEAHALSPVALVTFVPRGLQRSVSLIVMILMLGGMFAVLRDSGALDAGIRRLIAASRGDVRILVPVLMLAISAGSTFLGLISEYLLLIPTMILLAQRLGYGRMFGFAIVTLAAKVGYLASVTSPVALLIAQPIVGVVPFSGIGLRFGIWLLFLTIATLFVLGTAGKRRDPAPLDPTPLSRRHAGALGVVALVVAVLVYGSLARHWDDGEFSALFIAGTVVMASVIGLRAAATVHLFVEGMKTMVLPALLIGMGRAVELILREGQVLDTIVAVVAHHIHGLPPVVVAPLLMAVEMVLTLLIPSTSAKAALSIPVLGPIAASAGVSGQTTVLAFLIGNGLVNMLAPTSGMLLAYLATAGIPYVRWFRFAWPLFLVFAVLGCGAMMLAVQIGY